MEAVRLRITGRVQGVYFRQSSVEKAHSLKLVGYVRNCSDGSVELVAEGKSEDLALMIDWCRRGPPSADVKHVEVSRLDPEGIYKRFDIGF